MRVHAEGLIPLGTVAAALLRTLLAERCQKPWTLPLTHSGMRRVPLQEAGSLRVYWCRRTFRASSVLTKLRLFPETTNWVAQTATSSKSLDSRLNSLPPLLHLQGPAAMCATS